MPGEPSPEAIRHERLLILERGVAKPMVASAINLALLAWAASWHVATPVWAGWLLAGWAVLALRLQRARRVLAAPPAAHDVAALDRLDRGLIWHSLPASAFLVTTAVLFFDFRGNGVLLGVALLPPLIVGAQAAALALDVRATLLLAMPALLTLIGLCLHAGTAQATVLALGIAMYAFGVLRITMETGQTLNRQVALTVANRELAARLAEKAQQAEAANQAKSRFLAAASHDIRQPVDALALFLRSFDDTALAGRNAQLIGPLRETAMHLSDMLDGVLDLSRAEAGAVQATPTPLALQTLFERMEREFGPAAERRGLLLRTVPTQAWVRADALLLERILGNLVSNAVRYTHSGGVLVGARRRGSAWSVEVWDTGPGIATAEQPQLFDEFRRGSDAAALEGGGLGLGLAIAQRFAHAMASEVQVASTQGRGSVFRLRLPAAAASSSTQGSSTSRTADGTAAGGV